MKKISIIIPTLNSSRTILKTIKSIYEQTYKNWEIIIIDGGSRDSTLQIIKSFNIKNIKILFFPKKNSLSATRFYGVKKSEGELIAFLDSDDIWNRNKLYEQYLLFIKNNKFICTDYEIKSSNGNFIFKNSQKKIFLKDLIYSRPIALSSVLVEKNLLISVMKKNLNIHYAEDFYWWICILKKKYFCAVLSKCYTKLLYHKNNRSISFHKTLKSLLDIYRNTLNFNYLFIILVFSKLAINMIKKYMFKLISLKK